jgi:hypothetical protein
MLQNAQERAEEIASTPEKSPLEEFAGHFLSGKAAAEATKQQPATNGRAKPNGKH